MNRDHLDHKIDDRTKIRDGQVANRPVYVVMAVTAEGHRDILGIWAGDGGEGAKYWLSVFTDLKNGGVDDVLVLVCDGLKGLPEAVETVWPRTIVQTCVVHLLRNSFRHAARQDWDEIARAIKPVYTAPNEAAATERFSEFQEAWGRSTRRSSGSGRTPGPSSCPSSPAMSRSARSSARRTRSSPSTPASARPSAPADTSPTRPRP
ncbi:hypothetical protein GCM10020227_64250 [Streptomyces flavovirens]